MSESAKISTLAWLRWSDTSWLWKWKGRSYEYFFNILTYKLNMQYLWASYCHSWKLQVQDSPNFSGSFSVPYVLATFYPDLDATSNVLNVIYCFHTLGLNNSSGLTTRCEISHVVPFYWSFFLIQNFKWWGILQINEIFWELKLTAFQPCFTLIADIQRMLRNIGKHLKKHWFWLTFGAMTKLGLCHIFQTLLLYSFW